MNQNPSHSQTPQFDANKSQTSQRLYQHPTAAEMQSKKNIFGNICAVLLLLIVFIGLGYMMGVASDKEAVAKVQALQVK